MTARELMVLITELPGDSRFRQTRVQPWSRLEQLIAATANAVHGLREDYRGVHGAEYDWSPLEPPELPHIRSAREAAAAERVAVADARRDLMAGLLSGQLRMADIDTSRPIEEVLKLA